MAKCFIILGRINKLLLLPLFACLTQILYVIIKRFDLENDNVYNTIIFNLAISFGQMSVRLYPYILKISNKEEAKIKISKKKKCLHYFILSLIFLIDLSLGNMTSMFQKGNIDSIFFPNNDLNFISVEIIFLLCISAFLLKYKYFKHHIISLVIVIFLGVLCHTFYLISKVDKKKSSGDFLFNIIIPIIHVAFDAVYNCYQKYMMEKLYYPYWNVAFVPGIIQFVCGIIGLVLILFKKEFYSYFEENKIKIIIFKIVLSFVFHAIMCPLFILILYYFTPDFILIIFQFACFTKNLSLTIDNSYFWILCICAFLNIIQIFFLLIYLEIIELNFCGLNKNTKRNIDLRGQDDFFFEGRDSSVSLKGIDINKEYFIESLDKIENEVEMKEKNDEEEEKLRKDEKDNSK